MTYLIPILLITSLAAIMGFLLAFLSIRFNSSEDKTILELEELLPKINCGGCGYAGCNAFSRALRNGEVSIEKCRPASKENREKILRLLDKKSSNS